MKGMVFNIVEDVVVADHGEPAWDEMVARAGVGGVYTSLGRYPTADLLALVDAGAEILGVDPRDLTVALGTRMLSALAGRYPAFFDGHDSTDGFLLTLDDVIHPEVRKLHTDTRPPTFRFDRLDDGGLRVQYISERGLCAIAEGMIHGAARHFGETADVEHSACTADGAAHCVFAVRFRPGEPG